MFIDNHSQPLLPTLSSTWNCCSSSESMQALLLLLLLLL
jgi:hypothetical protein